MKVDDVPHVHLCFRCGEVEGEYEFDENSAVQKCNSCGDHGVITVQQGMDILNELVLRNVVVLQEISEVGYLDE